MTFALHPRLAADTLVLGDLGLSRLLLMNDARYPWLILVPRRAGLVEIIDLDPDGRAALMEEVCRCSVVLQQLTGAAKLNVGAIGNRVAQLHLHVVARFEDDPAWPDPVWGRGSPVPYDDGARLERVAAMSAPFGFG